MEPKFQSSFIPKGAVVSGTGAYTAPVKKERSIFGFLATLIFAFSLLAAVAAFGYKFYLGYSISTMASELDAAKASIDPETVLEITRLNNRLIAAESLIDRHIVLSPLLEFLESATVRSVRFAELNYSMNDKGLTLVLKGEARGYSDLAVQAETLKESDNFTNPVFSDLSLDDQGNVTFTFTADINPNLVSYRREIERNTVTAAPAAAATTTPAAAATATTTPGASTTTPPRN